MPVKNHGHARPQRAYGTLARFNVPTTPRSSCFRSTRERYSPTPPMSTSRVAQRSAAAGVATGGLEAPISPGWPARSWTGGSCMRKTGVGEQRVLVVSGAASGLGLASAVRFAARYDVGLIDIDQVRGEQAHRKSAHWEPGAVLRLRRHRQGQVTGAAREIKRALGRVDALHNNAGIQVRGGILRCTEDDWDRLYDVTGQGHLPHDAGVRPAHGRQDRLRDREYRLDSRRSPRGRAGGPTPVPRQPSMR